MGRNQHRQPALAGQIMDTAGCLAHAGGVETGQRLIKQQQARGIEQRLCQQQALALPTGKAGHRARCQFLCIHRGQCGIDLRTGLGCMPWQPPALAAQAEATMCQPLICPATICRDCGM